MRGYLIAAVMAAFIVSLATTAGADPLIYATGNDGRDLLRIDAKTGSVEMVGVPGQLNSSLLAFGPDGKLYTITHTALGLSPNPKNQLAIIDPGTGELSLIGKPFGKAIPARAMDFASDGTLYAYVADKHMVYRIDPHTGSLTEVGSLVDGTADKVSDFAVHPEDGTMYAVYYDALYTFDPSTPKLTKVADITNTYPDISAIAFDKDGSLYALSFQNQTTLYKLDSVTGVAEKIASVQARNVHSADIAP